MERKKGVGMVPRNREKNADMDIPESTTNAITFNDFELVLATLGGYWAKRSGCTSFIRGTIFFLTPQVLLVPTSGL